MRRPHRKHPVFKVDTDDGESRLRPARRSGFRRGGREGAVDREKGGDGSEDVREEKRKMDVVPGCNRRLYRAVPCPTAAEVHQNDTGRGRLNERHPRPVREALAAMRAGLHAGRAKLIQVDSGRRGRVLRPLFAFFRRARLFLALLDDGEACHDGGDGNQSDTQSANKRLP